jgi:hypothetical protein
MITTIKTRTGSIYRLDDRQLTWERVRMGEDSVPIRTDGGRLVKGMPAIVVGRSCFIWSSPATTTPVGQQRAIVTSQVREVTHE